MSVDRRCVDFAREFGAPEAKARELCRDPDLQRCAAFFRPRPGEQGRFDATLDNLAACYGTSSTERRP